ncbi:hypothetical protein QAD02_015635 [Eretmocerus hayati]|uniref:Uncharacterized protein n=1 Tax=Eretmocerus hayati TaxID=131215 RepID=A0ACC2P9T8_9HYME|nr:hypothetical protein QAD02_015635 [Eretmocerus hayati]
MGFLSSPQPFDADVEKATSHTKTSEDWALIMEICDKVGNSSVHAKDCLRSIVKRLNAQDPHIVILAITLLDACSSNCGKVFHLEIASREFENQFIKLLNNSRSQPKIYEKLKALLKKWAEGDFKTDPQLNLIPSLYQKLKLEGHDFSSLNETPKPQTYALSKDPNVVSSAQEEEEIAKAIELSLKESTKQSIVTQSSPSSKKTTSLYPNVHSALSTPSTSEGRKVKALYDFEAVEDNELTFTAGEIIHILDDSDPNWWKGSNKRGEGLFPSNFVTADLTVEPDLCPKLESNNKKSVQFNEEVEVKTVKREPEVVEVEIDEQKMDRCLNLLHEADPQSGTMDSHEMLDLEDQVSAMGPLIDTALEKVDKQHAMLTQLSSDLVDAMNLYHTLMREPAISSYTLPKMPPQQMVYPYPHPQGMHPQGIHPQAGIPQGHHHIQSTHPQAMHPPGMPPQVAHSQTIHTNQTQPHVSHMQAAHPSAAHLQGQQPQTVHPQSPHLQGAPPHLYNGITPGAHAQMISQQRFATNTQPTPEMMNSSQGSTSLPIMTQPHNFHMPSGLRQIPPEVRQESQQTSENNTPYSHQGFPVQTSSSLPVSYIHVPSGQHISQQQQFAAPNGQRMM